MTNRWGKCGNCQILFSWAPKSLQTVTAAMQLKDICYLEEKLWPVYHKAETSLCWKGPYSQRYGFPVVMYGYESWTIKKAEHQRIDAFELWCWRKLLRVPWTARRSNQLILKEISPEYSLEGLMQKLKLQYFGHLIRRAHSLGKPLKLGKIEGRRRRGQTTEDEMVVKGCCWNKNETGIFGFRRRGIHSGARAEAWLLRAFV